MRTGVTRWVAGAALLVAVAAAPARAQELSEEERLAAAEAAYDRGSRALRQGDAAAAARWYERADQLHPTDTALLQAIRSWRRAGDDRRAASLAVLLVERSGPELADRVRFVRAVAAASFRVKVVCAWCELEVDGQEERYRTFFFVPGEPHTLEAGFSTGNHREIVVGAAGEERTVTLQPPQPEAVHDPDDSAFTGEGVASERDAADGPADDSEPFTLPPPVLYVAAGVTAVLVAVTIWSALDTRSALAEFEVDPTVERLEDGNARETRTNVLLGVTLAAAAGTAVIAVLTDFGAGSAEDGQRVSFGLLPGGAAIGTGGAW